MGLRMAPAKFLRRLDTSQTQKTGHRIIAGIEVHAGHASRGPNWGLMSNELLEEMERLARDAAVAASKQ